MPTPKFLVIRRSVPGERKAPSPAEMQEMYATFTAWKKKFEPNLVDLGGKLLPGGKVVTVDGVKDGPFVEAKEVVGGYLIVAAESYEQALEIARTCPGALTPGGSLEIREMAG